MQNSYTLEVFGHKIPASDFLAGSVFNFGFEFAFRPLHFGEVPYTALSNTFKFEFMFFLPCPYTTLSSLE